MKQVRQDDCFDLDGLTLNLGKWVRAGKVAVDSGLAYLWASFEYLRNIVYKNREMWFME